MAVLWEIDPVSEDATNAAFLLTDATFRLLEMDLTPPDVDPMYAVSADTEGDRYVASRHRNRTVALTILAMGATHALTQTAIYGVQQKIEKLRREGGTLKFTSQAGNALVGDVHFARFKPEFSKELYNLNHAVKFVVEFDCDPYFRGAAVQLADHVEAALPYLAFTETGVGGDVPALGRLVIDDDQGVDQWTTIWAIRSRNYSNSANAALFYQAESRTATGGSAIAAGPSGASGAGSNVMRNTTLSTTYQAVMSTQATGGGAHLSHVGDYRVLARVQIPATAAGDHWVCLEWSAGDFQRATRNDAVLLSDDTGAGTPAYNLAKWLLVDLGQVHIAKVAQGTQRWEGRVLAKNTYGGTGIDIDCLFIVPVGEGSGEVRGVARLTAPTTYSARDSFDQTAGALLGKTAPTGGVWATTGDTGDFTVNATTHVVARTSGSSSQRWATLPVSLTNVVVSVDIFCDTPSQMQTMAAIARYVDTNNYVFARASAFGFFLGTKVAGTIDNFAILPALIPAANTWYTLALFIDAGGRAFAWYGLRDEPVGAQAAAGSNPVLATGGALATGAVGMESYILSGTQTFDNFKGWVPAQGPDASVFATRSVEVRNNAVIRADPTGTVWQTPSTYEGDYLLIPPAGREARTVEVFVKNSRGEPSSFLGDSAIDDLSARLTVTPRYLVLGP